MFLKNYKLPLLAAILLLSLNINAQEEMEAQALETNICEVKYNQCMDKCDVLDVSNAQKEVCFDKCEDYYGECLEKEMAAPK